MGQSGDGSGHVPWQAQEGADKDSDGHHEQVQVVAVPFLQPGAKSVSDIFSLVASMIDNSLLELNDAEKKLDRIFFINPFIANKLYYRCSFLPKSVSPKKAEQTRLSVWGTLHGVRIRENLK